MAHLQHYIQFATQYMTKADQLEKNYQFNEALTEYYNAIVNLEQIINDGSHQYQQLYQQQLTHCRERVNVLNNYNAGNNLYNSYNTTNTNTPSTTTTTSAYSMSVAGSSSYDQYSSNNYNQYSSQTYTDPYSSTYNTYPQSNTVNSYNSSNYNYSSTPSYTSSVSDTSYTNPYTAPPVNPITPTNTTPTYTSPMTPYTPPQPTTVNQPAIKDTLFPLRSHFEDKTQNDQKQKQEELAKINIEKKD